MHMILTQALSAIKAIVLIMTPVLSDGSIDDPQIRYDPQGTMEGCHRLAIQEGAKMSEDNPDIVYISIRCVDLGNAAQDFEDALKARGDDAPTFVPLPKKKQPDGTF